MLFPRETEAHLTAALHGHWTAAALHGHWTALHGHWTAIETQQLGPVPVSPRGVLSSLEEQSRTRGGQSRSTADQP